MSATRSYPLAVIVPATLAVSLNGCAIIGGIFKAGVWVGVLAVAFVVALIFGVVRMLGGSS